MTAPLCYMDKMDHHGMSLSLSRFCFSTFPVFKTFYWISRCEVVSPKGQNGIDSSRGLPFQTLLC